MKSVVIQPWIGPKYFTEGFNGKRILILGESHYCNGCEDDGPCGIIPDKKTIPDCLSNMTMDLIKNHLNKAKKITFVTKLENALNAAMDFSDNKQSVFEHIAYYDYIQQIVAETPGILQIKKCGERAQKPFSEVLEYLKPDFMLVLSERLWNNMPGETNVDWPLFKEISIDGKEDRIYWSGLNKKLPIRMYSFHPRTNMFRDIIPFLKEALRIITTEL